MCILSSETEKRRPTITHLPRETPTRSHSEESRRSPAAPDSPSLTEAKDSRLVLNKLGFVEEDRESMRGVHVRAATVDTLVALAVDSFGEWLLVSRHIAAAFNFKKRVT